MTKSTTSSSVGLVQRPLGTAKLLVTVFTTLVLLVINFERHKPA